MDILKNSLPQPVHEITLLQHIRLVASHDLNPIYSSRNFTIQFDIKDATHLDRNYGLVTSYLCLDHLDNHYFKNADNGEYEDFVFSVFIESVNILVGQQISAMNLSSHSSLMITAPRKSKISRVINSQIKKDLQKYELEIDDLCFDVIVEYDIQLFN